MDQWEKIFELAKQETGSGQLPAGHRERFLQKLTQQKPVSVRRFRWWYAAASLALIIGLAGVLKPADNKADLADVSPEMKSTELFFRQTINSEMDRLQGLSADPASQKLIDDALQQMKILETDYEKLRTELMESGYDKRVIYAMINNFQQRIDLLQTVLNEIETIKNFKNNVL